MKRHNPVKWIVPCLALLAASAAPRASAQLFSEARLQQACEALLKTPLSAPDLQTLAEASRSATNAPLLRSRAMAAYSLALLLQGNTNAFARGAQIQQSAFPDLPPLITIGPDDYTAVCEECLGTGEKKAPCPSCMGSGKCKTCGGTGKKAAADGALARCPACKPQGVCGMCAGQKTMDRPCPACKGTKKTFRLSENVRSNYTALLTGMASICQENADFAEQFRKAARENNSDARLQLLQALTNRFARRADLAPAQSLLGEALTARDARLKAVAEREVQERAQREVEALRKLEQAENLGGAIATLRAYLAEHPASPAETELRDLLDGLVARQERKRLTRNIFVGCGLLLGLLLLVLCLQPLLFRQRVVSAGPLPGMDRIKKADFTDPLSLTAHDSRARAKDEAAQTSTPQDSDLTQ